MAEHAWHGGEQKDARNAYRCNLCHESITTVNRDNGVTPMFLQCHATAGCRGTMQSAMYRLPSGAPEPMFEWFRAERQQVRRLERRAPGSKRHHEQGGLFLRKILL